MEWINPDTLPLSMLGIGGLTAKCFKVPDKSFRRFKLPRLKG